MKAITVTEIAGEIDMSISADEFRLLNLALDDAIASAVTEFARQRERSISLQGTEDMGVLAHEMRNFLTNALLSFDLIKEGQVTPRGSTAAILGRSLAGMQQLLDRSLAEVRLQAHGTPLHRVRLAELIEELELSATVAARSRGLQLCVPTVDYAIQILADRPLLASAISNLLQNALKFTRDHGMVTLRAYASAERVRIDVEDECGGLPCGKADELFAPFEQRGRDRSGVGLGLAIAKRAVEANKGTLTVRDLPTQGCVFTVDVPRLKE